MSRAFEYLDKNFARLEQHKDDKLSSHHGLPVEPTAETSTVVWPEAPPAQRLSLLMQARPSMAGLKAFLTKGREKL